MNLSGKEVNGEVKVKNPLLKRLPREFAAELGKYIVIFLFMALSIGFISGFLVAGGSMIKAYDESFDKYNIENGHFESYMELTDEQIEALQEEDITIYSQYYIEEETDNDLDGKRDSDVRIFKDRREVNKVCLMEGEMPQSDDEVALDRMYCDNNGIKVGDKVDIGGRRFTVSGLVALSDYSALFSDNSDLMFDSVKFGVGIMTDDAFDSFGNGTLHYCYVWKYDNEPVDDIEEKEVADKLMNSMAKAVTLSDFVPRYVNSAIQFTGDDMGGDKYMMLILLYILIVIMAFVFAVTCSHTIVRESAVIGTLRASGYSRRDMMVHYITLPILVSLLAAIVGNILGYTVFKNVVVAMYYGSYSLPTYTTVWNGEAFVLTTVVPVIIMLVVNVAMISRKLSLSPLRFLRRDINRTRRKKAVKLPHFKFFTRFRIRIILQNLSGYVTLFVGIAFAYILLLFGTMMHPLLDHYQDTIIDSMICDYQYILKAPVETGTEGAEKFSMYSLKYIAPELDEDISVYGITGDSDYFKYDVPDDGVVISSGIADKYGFDEGDEITLREAYGEDEYKFEIKDVVEYPGGMAVFMSMDEFNEAFGFDAGYFNGYFSNNELSDVDDEYIAACIDEETMTKTSRQLDVSMGNMFYMFNVFAVVLFIILIYLLTKLIIEKNSNSISMVKILGYKNSEISRLYLLATTIVVVISILLSMAIASVVIDVIYRAMMVGYSGWLTLYISPWVYVEIFVMGIASYAAVALLQMRKIKNVPMDEALKNVE